MDLSGNAIENLDKLAEALSINMALQTLDLSSNAIQDKGAEALAAAIPKNFALSIIDVSENEIEDPDVEDTLAELVDDEDRRCDLIRPLLLEGGIGEDAEPEARAAIAVAMLELLPADGAAIAFTVEVLKTCPLLPCCRVLDAVEASEVDGWREAMEEAGVPAVLGSLEERAAATKDEDGPLARWVLDAVEAARG